LILTIIIIACAVTLAAVAVGAWRGRHDAARLRRFAAPSKKETP